MIHFLLLVDERVHMNDLEQSGTSENLGKWFFSLVKHKNLKEKNLPVMSFKIKFFSYYKRNTETPGTFHFCSSFTSPIHNGKL